MRSKPLFFFFRTARLRQVVNILVKHGFGYLANQISPGILKKTRPLNEDIKSAKAARRLRLALEELGPTYVKLGQLLSTRPDLLNKEYIRELEKLQNEVPPISFAEVCAILDEEGIDRENSFSFFSEQPLAAASVAQVHRAVLKNGQEVAVKIQRQGIRKKVEDDLKILKYMAHILERRTDWGALYRTSEIVKELEYAILNELDFNKEARNADVFYRNFQGAKNVTIPKIFWKYSTKRVLTMEYHGGIKVSEPDSLKKAGYNAEKIANNLIDILFKQVFEHGFFHADPHPGNLAVQSGERIVFYDFGQVGTIDQITREKAVALLIGVIKFDTNAIIRALLDLGITTQSINYAAFRLDISRLQQKYYGLPLAQINMGEALAEIIELSFKHQVRIPSELSLLAKMLMTVENIISRLNPDLSMIDLARPYGEKLVKKRFFAANLKDNLSNLLLDYASIAGNLPRDITNIIRMLEAGQIKMQMEHTNLKRLTNRIDILSNRLSVAIIIASIIMGTSFVVKESGSNLIRQLPLVEVGFLIALVLGLGLVYSIFKSGRY
ncbi:MAG TPA: AarF/ABC1/UbiB kinase family protein [Firmicutes bacterium]|nr:AarF/ABC1/UbiB kinase family protein [Bacillota bacterium]